MKTLDTPNTVSAWNWQALAASLDKIGYAITPPALSPADCAELIALYDRPEPWRSRVEPSPYRLGPGEYRHFDDPLPNTVAMLRTECYQRLAPVANAWRGQLGIPGGFPDHLDGFLTTCHNAGQTNPTPLVMRHRAQEFNCLHQDDHEGHVFPLQMTVMLSRARQDYTGGELLLVENLPRAQSRGRAVVLKQGQAVIWPTYCRPGTSNRGHYRIGVRYGISTVHTGVRHALGVNFHDTA
ncbi:MAG TPA: 2OG-Fe(II) oxygenase [Pseudonocardiaceae bacterium]|nr:2OG-Fe(II) oxygenase [Pseudonocardiaceae bacterium]